MFFDYSQTLVGSVYTVHIGMNAKGYEDVSRGDHGLGGGAYTKYYGTGEVAVRDKEGRAVAVCGLGFDEWANGRKRKVDTEAFRRCVEVVGLLPEQEQAYADWFAEKIIAHFRAPNPGGHLPRLALAEPDRAELIRLGFVLDSAGQAALPL